MARTYRGEPTRAFRRPRDLGARRAMADLDVELAEFGPLVRRRNRAVLTEVPDERADRYPAEHRGQRWYRDRRSD